MHDRLKKIYFRLLAPAVVGFMALYPFRQVYPTIALPDRHMAIVAPAIFILAAVFAISGPIFCRSLFSHRHRHHVKVSLLVLYRFERNLIGMVLVTPYLALVGHVLQLPRFYLAGTLLMALYAGYYYYPFEERIRFDGKLFRTADAMAVDRIR